MVNIGIPQVRITQSDKEVKSDEEIKKLITRLIMYKMGITRAIEKENYVEAFILANLIDKHNVAFVEIYPVKKTYYFLTENKRVQKHLFTHLSYHQTLAITLKLRENLRQFAYTAFIYAGCDSLELGDKPTLQDFIRLKDHLFIQALKAYAPHSKIPLLGIEYFIQKLVIPLLGIGNFNTAETASSGSEDEIILAIELALAQEQNIRDAIALDWLSILPSGFSLKLVKEGEELQEYLNNRELKLRCDN